MCNLQLTSDAQAQLHYNGRSHLRRVRQLRAGGTGQHVAGTLRPTRDSTNNSSICRSSSLSLSASCSRFDGMSLTPAGAQPRSLPRATGLSSQPAGLTPTPGLGPGLSAPPSATAGKTGERFVGNLLSSGKRNDTRTHHKDCSGHARAICICAGGTTWQSARAADPNSVTESHASRHGNEGGH